MGRCSSRRSAARPWLAARSKASTQTQRRSGYTSQPPSAPTPPQGPLRSSFGQPIGHTYPVTGSAHWPHIRQPNRASLVTRSAPVNSGRARPDASILALSQRTPKRGRRTRCSQ